VTNGQLSAVEPPGQPEIEQLVQSSQLEYRALANMAALENWEDVFACLLVPISSVFCSQEETNRYISSSSFTACINARVWESCLSMNGISVMW